MLTFKEWLEKKGIQLEIMGRLSQMTHEQLPDKIPQIGQVVMVVDKPKAIISSDDVYKVSESGNPGKIAMIPLNKTNPPFFVDVEDWEGSIVPPHLLADAEKSLVQKVSGSQLPTVWVIGVNKDRWLKNREDLREKQAKKKKLNTPTLTQQSEPSKSLLHQLRQGLQAGQEPKQDPRAAWSSLFGGE